MKGLYVVGDYGTGKTAVCLGIVLKARDEGRRVGYFKPVANLAGVAGREDDDVLLMQELLQSKPEDVTVLTASGYYLAKYKGDPDYLRRGIVELYRSLVTRYDILVMEGPAWLQAMMSLGIDAFSLAKAFDASAVLTARVRDDLSVDQSLLVCDYIRTKQIPLAGVIFNNVPRQLLDKTRGVYRPLFEDRGFAVLGIIPEVLEISAPTVREVHNILGGELLEGEEGLDATVEDVLVGAMSADTALSYFRRTPNKVVITGGDRADIALAALHTNTSALILTGNLYPNVRVLAEASQKKVPVILVPYDTYTAIEKFHQVTKKFKPTDVKAINLAKENFERHCDWRQLVLS